MNQFRIGIIGAGAIVEGNHLPAIKNLQQARVAWIFDKDPVRMALVSKMYGVPALADRSVGRALEEVDICLLATPYGVRRPYMDLCRTLGKSLVVEKPFAFSQEEHLANCDGFRPWEIAVNFQRRWYRSIAGLGRIIREGLFGNLRSVRYVQGNFTLKGGSGYLSNVELSGGGVIAESAIHTLDILLSITATSAVRLLGLGSLHRSGLDYDTVFESEFTRAGETVPVHCEISTLRNLDNGVWLDFEHALVSCDLSPEGKIFVRRREDRQVEYFLTEEMGYERLPLQATSVNQAFLIFWQQFLDGLENQAPNRTSAGSSQLVSAWLEEIYKKIKLS